MSSHKDLKVWKDCIQLAKKIYLCTEGFPSSEAYNLTSQMRRAAVSIASNIAEGAARQTSKEFVQFLYIALGSGSELDTQLFLASELGIIDQQSYSAISSDIASIQRMIQGLIRYKSHSNQDSKRV